MPRASASQSGKVAFLGALAACTMLLGPSSEALGVSQQKNKASDGPANSVITENDKIVHVLNRLGFGARPDDVAKVKQMGLSAYIEKQLHPDQVDDSAVEAKLRGFSELNMTNEEIAAKYKDFITSDQTAAKLRQQMRKAREKLAAQTTDMAMTAQTAGQVNPPASGLTNSQINSPKPMAGDDPDLTKQLMENRQVLVKTAEPIGLLHEEFNAAKLIRAAESQRQLQEVLVDFWSNHFNIDIRKAPCGVLKVIDDRDVIRPHIWGKFRDLLEASAKSPAMLVYLDNFQSIADQLPNQKRARRNRSGQLAQPPVTQTAPKRKVGLNENYAREIMELHTLGVDGGYTQQDVHEVARCFTGWSIGSPDGKRPRINRYGEAGVFQFYPRVHDEGEKVVLGHHIPAGGGMQDGEAVLDLLASDRMTWRHISYQLCQRLVCDEPPISLVNKCIMTWQNTDGDLREIVKTIVTSPEFYSPVALRKKIKSPFEFAVSSVRALDGTLDPYALVPRKQLPREANSMVRPPQGGGYLDINTNTLLGQIGTMGEPIFQYQAPTGFPEDSRKWVSSGALISRLNFSLALTQGRLTDVKLEDPSEDASNTMNVDAMIDRVSNRILHGQISKSTRATLLREAQGEAGSKVTPATIAALLLGSPEFQRR